MKFTPSCRLCPRLADFLDEVRRECPGYFARPVPSFGDAQARLLIVGLAPGMHGANRTGRPFTGDYAGGLLYSTLHRFGYASQPEPLDAEGAANAALSLHGCRITNAVRCLPPQNKPEPAEVKRCNRYLAEELATVPQNGAVLALGTVAHQATLRALALRAKDYPFAHGAEHPLQNGIKLFDSYHCSRYNTQTRRLNEAMFHEVFDAIAAHLQRAPLL
jgi:uracil-DNA glycosylase family 4